MSKKKTGNGSYQIATVPVFFMGAKIKLLRSRNTISREKVFCIAYASFKPFMPCKSRLFCPYCVTRVRRFLMRSAACLRVIRFRQSGQYLTLFDFDTKNMPHSVQRFLSSVLKSSA